MHSSVVLHTTFVVPFLVGMEHLLVTCLSCSIVIFVSAARLAICGTERDRVVCRFRDGTVPECSATRLVVCEDVRVRATVLCDGGVC